MGWSVRLVRRPYKVGHPHSPPTRAATGLGHSHRLIARARAPACLPARLVAASVGCAPATCRSTSRLAHRPSSSRARTRPHQASPAAPLPPLRARAPPPPPPACLRPIRSRTHRTPCAGKGESGGRRGTQEMTRQGGNIYIPVSVCVWRGRGREREIQWGYIYIHIYLSIYTMESLTSISHTPAHTQADRQTYIYTHTHTYIYIHVHTWVCVHMRPSLSPRPSPCPSTSLPSRARALRFRPTAPVNWRAPPPRAPPPLRHTAARRAPLPPNSAGQLAAPLPHHLPFPPFLLLLLLLLALPSPCPRPALPRPHDPPAAGRWPRAHLPAHSLDRPTDLAPARARTGWPKRRAAPARQTPPSPSPPRPRAPRPSTSTSTSTSALPPCIPTDLDRTAIVRANVPVSESDPWGGPPWPTPPPPPSQPSAPANWSPAFDVHRRRPRIHRGHPGGRSRVLRARARRRPSVPVPSP